MTAITLYCGLVLASSAATMPKDLTVEVRVCKGDPLGTRADGNVRYLVEATITTPSGKSVQVRAGGEVPIVFDGKRTDYMFLGTRIELEPVARVFGNVWAEVNLLHATQVPANGGVMNGGHVPGFSEQMTRISRTTKLGETFKHRISANDPNDQVWVEVTIRAAAATSR